MALNTPSDEYELVPYREIQDLKDEVRRLKEYPIPPGRQLGAKLDDVAIKADKLITIFEEAAHQLRVEEGGLTYEEKLKPILAKMNKILEQNSEIAEGIVALADIVNDLKDKMEKGFLVKETREVPAGRMFEEPRPMMDERPIVQPRPMFGTPQQAPAMPGNLPFPELPPLGSAAEAPLPPPPMPPRRRLFA